MDAGEDMVTAVELADILRVSPQTVWRMARQKEIPAMKIGRSYRFYPSEVRFKLANPATPPSWSQSARSTSRKRAA